VAWTLHTRHVIKARYWEVGKSTGWKDRPWYEIFTFYEYEEKTRLEFYIWIVVLGGLVVFVPLDPTFAASDRANDDGFLRVIKIRSTTSFVREVKLSAPCRKNLEHVKNPCEVDYNGHISLEKLTDISRQISPCFAAKYVCWYLPEISGWRIVNN
jgi:hypothetical protein